MFGTVCTFALTCKTVWSLPERLTRLRVWGAGGGEGIIPKILEPRLGVETNFDVELGSALESDDNKSGSSPRYRFASFP
jgi:hypothetical protein